MYRRLSMNRYEKKINSGSIILLYTIFPEQLNLNWLIGVDTPTLAIFQLNNGAKIKKLKPTGIINVSM